MALTVREYLTADGKNPFREWLDSLTISVRAQIQACCGSRWATSAITRASGAASGRLA